MKKIIVLSVFAFSLILCSPMYIHAKDISCCALRAKNRERIVTATAYISSLVASGAVGALTGGVVRHFEKKVSIEDHPIALFIFLLGWALESEVRNDIIMALQRTMDEYGIAYKKGLMFTTSRLASWASYLHAYES